MRTLRFLSTNDIELISQISRYYLFSGEVLSLCLSLSTKSSKLYALIHLTTCLIAYRSRKKLRQGLVRLLWAMSHLLGVMNYWRKPVGVRLPRLTLKLDILNEINRLPELEMCRDSDFDLSRDMADVVSSKKMHVVYK